jgi:hypothetical protein
MAEGANADQQLNAKAAVKHFLHWMPILLQGREVFGVAGTQ